MITFYPGNIVRLKSLGCKMTVLFEAELSTDYVQAGVHCYWHDQLGVPHAEVYDPQILVKS